jgi:tRNA pseudouridine32 synthase/23S rRNA pseudouridine746 synthase
MPQSIGPQDPCFTLLQQVNEEKELPKEFTFPFFYTPDPITLRAAIDLQRRISADPLLTHEFNDPSGKIPSGKMLGVLVVHSPEGELGYLCAHSGKLASNPAPTYFVPPVANIHADDSYYKAGEKELNEMTAQIHKLKRDPDFLRLKEHTLQQRSEVESVLREGRAELKRTKNERQKRREQAREVMTPEEFEALNEQLTHESISGQLNFKGFSIRQKEALAALDEELAKAEQHIRDLEELRRGKSNELQAWIFNQYQFLNANGQSKSLTAIFPDFETQQPPSGAGECCAPKLLQYAYANGFTAIAMGEFWWGASPKNEVRKQGFFYPSCNSRCRPILGHMLEGLRVEANPLLTWSDDLDLPIIYDDESLVIVNKPEAMLSVPGKDIEDSAYTRILAKYPEATGAVLLHRLDMSTSGILVFAKNPKAHKFVQRQFIKRTLKKRYVALVNGIIEAESGTISLPLRPDYYDLPRQMVCYEHGKPATTHFEVIERRDGKTRLALYPVTGRTHQLRVHCAHPEGLNTPIYGDELYGIPQNRLHLHAEFIQFIHPETKEEVSFTVPPNF